MAWGFWNKIKKGMKKAWNFAKDKIIKPTVGIAKKIVPFVAPAIDKIKPGAGSAISTGVDVIDGIINRGDWSKAVDNVDILNKHIRLK